ncbi:MAG TPA: ABC-type transport auxiliary lipoprotein family protein [Nitrospira sp.]|nr:ABC-type transport auxiliary lipoprotein family protein [Nitrospira sp.]
MNLGRTTRAAVTVATVLILCSGCLNLDRSYPEKRSFVLDVAADQRDAAGDAGLVLKITKFRVSPLFTGRAMVYRVGELQYENDFYNEWFVSPGSLVTQQYHKWLSKAGRFSIVLTGTNHIEPTHVLEGTVTEFYGDYRGEPPQAIFGVEMIVLGGDRERDVLLTRTYRQLVPLADRSPEALAAGLSEGLRRSLVDLDRDLSGIK